MRLGKLPTDDGVDSRTNREKTSTQWSTSVSRLDYVDRQSEES